MNALVLTTSNKSELKIFSELAKLVGIQAKVLSDEDVLDFGLLKAMEEGRKSKIVSKESVMKKLKQ